MQVATMLSCVGVHNTLGMHVGTLVHLVTTILYNKVMLSL